MRSTVATKREGKKIEKEKGIIGVKEKTTGHSLVCCLAPLALCILLPSCIRFMLPTSAQFSISLARLLPCRHPTAFLFRYGFSVFFLRLLLQSARYRPPLPISFKRHHERTKSVCSMLSRFVPRFNVDRLLPPS